MIRDEGDDLDTTATGPDDIGTDDRVGAIVAALDEDIGLEQLNQLERRVFIEEHDAIDAAQRGDDAGTVVLCHKRTT